MSYLTDERGKIPYPRRLRGRSGVLDGKVSFAVAISTLCFEYPPRSSLGSTYSVNAYHLRDLDSLLLYIQSRIVDLKKDNAAGFARDGEPSTLAR